MRCTCVSVWAAGTTRSRLSRFLHSSFDGGERRRGTDGSIQPMHGLATRAARAET